MHLWATEQSRKDLFIDLFSQKYHDVNWTKKTHEDIERYINVKKDLQSWAKDNETACNDREIGKTYFLKQMYRTAIDFYNKSLCFAELNSQNISLIYSDRSACFFNMKMYDKCLVDIELALQNG